MKINIVDMLLVIERQKQIDVKHRGAQPLLALGCFYSLRRDDTEYCETCRSYETCVSYLRFFEIRKPVFRKK